LRGFIFIYYITNIKLIINPRTPLRRPYPRGRPVGGRAPSGGFPRRRTGAPPGILPPLGAPLRTFVWGLCLLLGGFPPPSPSKIFFPNLGPTNRFFSPFGAPPFPPPLFFCPPLGPESGPIYPSLPSPRIFGGFSFFIGFFPGFTPFFSPRGFIFVSRFLGRNLFPIL